MNSENTSDKDQAKVFNKSNVLSFSKFFENRKRKNKLLKIRKIRLFYYNCVNIHDCETIKKELDNFFKDCQYYSISIRNGFSCTVIIDSSKGNFYSNAFFDFTAFHSIVKDIYYESIKCLR